MNKNNYLLLLIPFLFTIVCYISTNNIIISLIVFFISFVYFFFIGIPRLKKSKTYIDKYHECFHFINSIIISLSIKPSISNAINSSLEVTGDEFNEVFQGVEELEGEEKLKYLSRYFSFHIYGLFLNVINLFINQGGDILLMSKQLLNEARNIEEYVNEIETISRRKTSEFIILWSISLLILVILRFALNNFFNKITNQLFFPISIGIFFLFLLISIHILIIKITSFEIRGFNDNETI